MTIRFWVGVALSIPLPALTMLEHAAAQTVYDVISPRLYTWIQFLAATPVVLWGGSSFFARVWQSIRNRRLKLAWRVLCDRIRNSPALRRLSS